MVTFEQENPKFYLCERFYANEAYLKFSKLPIHEVVSVDRALFPDDERTLIDEKTAKTLRFMDKLQILRVYCITDEVISPIEEIDDFIFCGYDLADDLEISALTNCGGFDDVFTYKDLNSLGLIQDFVLARKIRADLENKYPEDEHASCLLFAIWRKT